MICAWHKGAVSKSGCSAGGLRHETHYHIRDICFSVCLCGFSFVSCSCNALPLKRRNIRVQTL